MMTSPTAHLATAHCPPQLIVFDLGGVVVRICRSWSEACTAANIALRHDERFTQPNALARRKALHAQHEVGQIACDDYFAAISSAIEGLYSSAEVRAIHTAWITGEYTGMPDLLRRLSASQSVRTACLSNTNAAHWAQMQTLLSPLHHRFASHLLNLAKPDEQIYRAVERATGVAPEQIMFFDDLPDNIEAARKCGWIAVQIDHTIETRPQIEAALARHGVQY